jgi:hypothetical protein
MTTKITIEIHPDGEKCGGCNTFGYDCHLSEARGVKGGMGELERVRGAICLAAQATAPSPALVEASDSEIEKINEMADETIKYLELLYAVERKFPGESRHETALRYIREAESHATSSAAVESAEREGKK